MKRNVLYMTVAMFATGSLLADPKDDVQGAVKKLADAPSYSWSTTTANAGGGGQGGRGGGFGRGGAANMPAAEATALLGGIKELKAADGVISGDLTKEAVAARLFPFGGGRRGGAGGGEAPPPPENAKGSVKFWVKDGSLAKYQYNVQGTMSFGGNDIEINRTTTVEIKDVGTTKVEVPEEAKKKLQ